MEVCNKRWSDEEFAAVRREVLAEWPTGREVDIDEAVAFHRSLRPGQNHARKLAAARQARETLVQPTAGEATLEGHGELLRFLQDVGLADVLPTQVDSLTRTHRFVEAGQAIVESERGGKSKLNGYPIVNHGVAKTRRIVEQLSVPLELRAGAPDLRLVAEIAFAAGYSGFTVGPIYYTLHYSKAVPLDVAIHYWQHIFRLAGSYEERGIPITLNVHGASNAVHFPHSILNAAVILETLLAAEQGVKNVHIDTRCMGSVFQDVTAARIAPRIVEDYCRRFGYDDVNVYTMNKSWCGPFPEDEAGAYALIGLTSIAGALAEVDEVVVKSVEEAIGVPSKEMNAASIRSVKHMLRLVKNQRVPLDAQAVATEAAVIEAETRAIVDRVIEVGDGDVARGIMRAVAAGILDAPFAASRHCAGRVVIVRDKDGAVRFLDPGNVPVPAWVMQYHRQKIAEREALLGRKIGYQTIVDDVMFPSTGRLPGSEFAAAQT